MTRRPSRRRRAGAASILAFLVATAAVLLLAPPTARAQQDPADGHPELPGWYRFYKKAGDQTVIGSEARRDAAIADGELQPRSVEMPLPDLALPDVDGRPVSLRGWVGRRNLLIVVNRAWW